MDQGIDRISSSDLSRRMHLTASQIRQDLNNFGGFGQQGYGYNVKNLHEEIAKILNIDREHSMIIIGAGHLGIALANYTSFRKRGFVLRGIFDSNPKLWGEDIGTGFLRRGRYLEFCPCGFGTTGACYYGECSSIRKPDAPVLPCL